MHKITPQFWLPSILFILFAAIGCQAQSASFEFYYKFEPAMVTRPPELKSLNVAFPDAALKNGAEGTVRVSMTLGEDGKVRDIQILQDIPFGVGEAVKNALEKWTFQPAMLQGKPVPMRMTLDYVVTLVFSEGDSSVTKPQIITKPITAEYPAKYLPERTKGTVLVQIIFFGNGKLKVTGVSSTMPVEFDKAATAAAEKLQFQPAIHKKSKKPVSQVLTIPFPFKP